MMLADLNPFIRFAEKIPLRTTLIDFIGLDCRLFYMISGELEITVDSATYTLTPNMLFYCHSGIEYKTVVKKDVIVYSLNFDLSQEHSNVVIAVPPITVDDVGVQLISNDILSDYEKLNSHIIISDGSELKNDVKSIVNEFAYETPYHREYASSLLKKILIQLVRMGQSTNKQYNNLSDKISDYIVKNCKENISNEKISDFFGYHPYHINRVFKESYGTTIHKYIIQCRLSEAKKLLLYTDMSVSEICNNVGFNDLSHFSEQFKKATGYTPKLYRVAFVNKL